MKKNLAEKTVGQVRLVLQENADEKIRISGERFFKEQVQCYGMSTAQGRRIGKQFLAQLEKEVAFSMGEASPAKASKGKADAAVKAEIKKSVFACCELFWQSGYMEEGFIACQWAYAMCKEFEPADFEVFERWVNRYVSNWAACDTLCNHAVGDFVMMYPAYVERLKKWAQSSNRWVKRGAAVTLIIPARKGLFLPEVFEIADLLIEDADDLVQKGYGWMLKAASEAHQQAVFDFLMARKATMPRTAFRYALEKMPKELRAQAMQKA